jgi:hypothetical protein
MSNFAWNKKALAALAAVTLLGALSPISALAEDMGPTSITYTVDLADGGGGGGGPVCPTQSTFTVDPKASQPHSLGTTPPVTEDVHHQNLYADNIQDTFNEWERNTKRSYAFTPIEVTFDADGCEASNLTAVVYPTRGPVMRALAVGQDFAVAEIRNDETPGDGGFGTADNVGMANLYADQATPWGSNFSAPYWDKPLWNTAAQLDSNSENGDWYPMAGGSNGEFKVQPRLDIFGTTPTGVYKVTYKLWLDVYDPGISGNNFCWWFCN